MPLSHVHALIAPIMNEPAGRNGIKIYQPLQQSVLLKNMWAVARDGRKYKKKC